MKTASKKYMHQDLINEIYLSFCGGEERRRIKYRFKISDTQFVKIIYNKIKMENKTQLTEILSGMNVQVGNLKK